jgi:type III secretion system low calcium response chaperone LcrH/SycD
MADAKNGTQEVDRLTQSLQRWAEGRGTLKEVRGYSDAELFAVARTAYMFFNQGKLAEARTLFQGLFAVNPKEPYFARALGVVEQALGNADGALAAFDVAIKLQPDDPAAYVARAEIRILKGQGRDAAQDLQKALSVARDEEKPLRNKAMAILGLLKSPR